MNLYDAFVVITHCSSQLLSRWIPLPQCKEYSHLDNLSLREISFEDIHKTEIVDWEDAVLEDQCSQAPILGWFKKAVAMRPNFLSEVCKEIANHLKSVKTYGGEILLLTDPRYPESLRSIAKPPLMLTCLGSLDALAFPKIAVIGSRQASYFAINETVKLGKILAAKNLCVVSGGAIGCDIAVHHGMLQTPFSQVRACAVLAGGLHKLYPRRHEFYFDQILSRGGLILSERLWHQPSIPRDFPIRNRIVSGLSECVVVTQAGESSGALITADEALEQGREVYVLIHDAQDIRALGSKRLIDDGAKAFSSAEEFAGYIH